LQVGSAVHSDVSAQARIRVEVQPVSFRTGGDLFVPCGRAFAIERLYSGNCSGLNQTIGSVIARHKSLAPLGEMHIETPAYYALSYVAFLAFLASALVFEPIMYK
jgi:hypothetical protein